MALINKQKEIDEIRDFQAQVTCSYSKDWESGMNEGFDHAVGVIELMETVDAIPVEWIKQFIKKENIDIINKVGIVDMVNQWKLHPINFEISSEDAIPISWLTAQAENPSNSDELRNAIDDIVYRLWAERKEE